MSSLQGKSTSFLIILHTLLYLTWSIWNCWHLTWEARATALSCQWLMGRCSVNSVTLPDGKSWSSGVSICSNLSTPVWLFSLLRLWLKSCFWSSWLQSPGVHWEMQVFEGEQMPWYLYQHVQTANSGLLMPCIWNSRFLFLHIFLDRLCPSGIFYQKYRHNDIQSNYVFCMAIVSFTEWSSKFLFHRKRSKKFPDRNALFIFGLYALWMKVISDRLSDPFSEVLLFSAIFL